VMRTLELLQEGVRRAVGRREGAELTRRG
jgi:hypothetical protein